MLKYFFAILILVICCNSISIKPRKHLKVFSVGVDYKNESQEKFSQEADIVANSFTRNSLYATDTTVLKGQQVDKKYFLKQLKLWVSYMTSEDIGIVYVSAHGYESYDFRVANKEIITGEEFLDVLKFCRGKIVIFQDTCHAGALLETHQSENFIIICACSKEENASILVMCNAISSGLNGEADENKDQHVTIKELNHYITTTIKKQHVVSNKVDNTIIAKVN